MEKIKENTTYKEGDVVVYGSQGICRITGTEKMRVGGKSTVYFILNPVYRKNSKIFVPSDNEKLMEKMHSVIEKDEIDELLYDLMNGTGIYSLPELFGDKWDKEDPLGNNDFNMNLLAWFGFEETMRNIGYNFEQLQDCI